MNRRRVYFGILVILVVLMGACSKNSENEHLPEYCQTYAGFSATASRDLFELLDDSGYDINRFNYLSVISEIELEFEVDDPNREIDLGGIQCFQNLTSLSLIGHSFKDISEISALRNIQSIQLISTSVVSIDSFKNLSKINSLVISDTKTLQSVEGVGEMTKLTDLDLSDNGLVNIGELNDLVHLKHLYLNDNEIVVFPNINQLHELETMDISHNNIVKLGDDLSGLSNLLHLNASHNEICDLSTLDELSSLRTLDLSYNDLGCVGLGVSPDFDSLENAPNLREIKLNNNNLTSISGLEGRDINLTILHLQNNLLTDITPISAYTGLTELVLYNNNIVDIDDLSEMTGLTSIDLSFNNIVDFSDLRLIPNLSEINLNHNNILVIPDISTSWAELTVLDLSSNAIQDTSGVEGHPTLEELYLYDNGMTEIEGISNLPELHTLEIDSPLEEVIHEDLGVITFTNPNLIRVITNCFNATPKLTLNDEDHYLDLGFTLGNNVEIYDSITGYIGIVVIDLSSMNINVINENSVELPNLAAIIVDDNNLTDIRFILGNPNLVTLIISENPITNLSVISGLATDDLDNLELVDALNINADNDLINAFIDLPSLETVDLTETRITSISNCFNDLENLVELAMDSNQLESISNSFNNIFGTYSEDNVINFASGRIGVIEYSFNGGQYHNITINFHSALIAETIIQDSFNTLTFSIDGGLFISNNNFKTIDGSFHEVSSDILFLSGNSIETITDSFTLSTIGALDLNNNLLQTVPSLNTITAVDSVDLAQNQLTTVSFIDAVSGLSELYLDFQQDEFSNYTLPGIDGINNVPLLTNLSINNMGITYINGFQNTGLEEIYLSLSDNGFVSITTIGNDAFTGSPITVLEFDGHAITTLAFLDNLDTVEILDLGLNTVDFSGFSGIPLELTLTTLTLHNAQSITDFSYLVDYDILESLTIQSDLTEITNLDDLDGLTELTIGEETIVTISNSFNNMPSFEPSSDYLQVYTSLTSITDSFDLYGSIDNTVNTIRIFGDSYSINNSFNQVENVILDGLYFIPTPIFDAASFDNVTLFEFQHAAYTDYAFLNGYTSLETVTISELWENIINLSNDQIETFTIDTGDTSVDVLTLDLSATSTLNYTSARNGVITVETNAQLVNLETANADINIDNTTVSMELNGTMNTIEINSSTLETVVLNSTSTSTTFNTPLLNTISKTATLTSSGSIEVNSNQTTLSVDVETTSLTIIDNFATTYDITLGNSGNVQLNNIQPDITVDFSGNNLTVDYNTLESITVTGVFNNLIASSTQLDIVNLGTSTMADATLLSSQPSIVISGNNVGNVDLTDDAITDLSANTPNAVLLLQTANNQLLDIDIITDEFQLNGALVPSINIQDTSTINTLDLATNSSGIHTLSYGNAIVPLITVDTTENSLTINGVTTSNITITGVSIDTLSIDSPNSTVSVEDLAVTVTALLIVDTIDLASSTLSTLNLNALSTLSALTISSSPSFTTLQTNDITIDDLTITTDATTIAIYAQNATNTIVQGDFITDALIHVGNNDVSLTTQDITLNLDLVANEVNVTLDAIVFTIDNTSTLTTLNLTAPNMTSLSTNALITDVSIIDASAALVVTGTNVTTLDVTGDTSSFTANVGTTTEVLFNSTNTVSVVAVTVSSDTVDIISNTDINLTGPNLIDITFNVGTNDIDMQLDKASLDAIISGTANTLSVDGTDMNSLTLRAGSNLTGLILNLLNIIEIDTTGSAVETIDITSDQTSFTVTAPNTTTITVSGTSSSITVNNTNPAGNLIFTSTAASLDINGQINSIDITANSATSINVDDVTVNDLEIQANILHTLSTGNTIANSLTINSISTIFTLSSNTPVISVNGPTDTLNFSSTSTNPTSIDAEADIVSFSTLNSDITLSDTSVNTVTGIVKSININTTDSGTLTLDLDADTITVDSTNPTTINIEGIHLIDAISITSSSLLTLDTNSVEIGSLTLFATNNNTVITTAAPLISLTSTLSANSTVTYTGLSAIDISLIGVGNGLVTVQNSNEISIDGDMVNMEIVGNLLDTITTDNLNVSTKYTMNNTLVNSLQFASTALLNSVSEIEVNTLSNTVIEDIINTLSGLTITLYSPLTDTDLYNYYYVTEYDSLVAQEALDSVRYDALRNTAVNDSWTEVSGNQYMDYLDETTTKQAIADNTLLSIEQYFQNYLTNEGTDEPTLGEPASTTARNAIQVTLDQIDSIMDDTALQNAVISGMETDADTLAIADQGTTTFTIG